MTVSYTKPLTYTQLKKKIELIETNLKMKVQLSQGQKGDKVAFNFRLTLRDGSKADIYDYKATSIYDDSLPSVAAFKRKPYEWHVQASNDIILAAVLSILNSEV